ncbi:hypothetical protein [Larkinella punicea]|uniref:Uncharacterized protein n=1 Tax=Larkinella punicea TaxID=2315727 RepID=A0A368JUA5_9BACT|nr:hypothetical protein [Larkinella punicea]RCR71237.1 hypothetical protein DUE52_03025 [Larkinella punicea]
MKTKIIDVGIPRKERAYLVTQTESKEILVSIGKDGGGFEEATTLGFFGDIDNREVMERVQDILLDF